VSGEVGGKSMKFDAPNRFDVPISALLLAISFGRILWMLEKAGISHSILLGHLCMQCTLVDHGASREAQIGGEHGFPGDRAMNRRLLPTALWLCMRECVWRYMARDP